MTEIKISTPFIKLDQFIKFSGLSFNGAEAKNMVQDGIVFVNGEEEMRRGRKLFPGDTVKICFEDEDCELKVI